VTDTVALLPSSNKFGGMNESTSFLESFKLQLILIFVVDFVNVNIYYWSVTLNYAANY